MLFDRTPSDLRYGRPLTRLVDIRDFNDVLIWGADREVSDFDIKTDRPLMVQRHGRRYVVTEQPLTRTDVQMLADAIYDGAATAILAGGHPVNCSYSVSLSRDRFRRFRVNMTRAEVDGRVGINLTLRSLPEVPPRLSEMEGIEPELRINFRRPSGLTLVVGGTGSGKSTLLAGGISDDVLDPEANRKYVTGEAPIEFVFNGNYPSSEVYQTEIPRDLPSFTVFIEEAMRRKPEAILVGESRDRPTVCACLEACKTGHQTFSTLHVSSVAGVGRRLVAFFPAEERDGFAIDLAANLNMVVAQTLLPTADGRRAAAREILVLDHELRDRLADAPTQDWYRLFRQMVQSRGQPMIEAIERLAPRLSEETLSYCRRHYAMSANE